MDKYLKSQESKAKLHNILDRCVILSKYTHVTHDKKTTLQDNETRERRGSLRPTLNFVNG